MRLDFLQICAFTITTTTIIPGFLHVPSDPPIWHVAACSVPHPEFATAAAKNLACQLSRSALTSARTDAQSNCINHLRLGSQTSPFLPPLPPAKNKPRLNVSVTFLKGALCFQWALLLRCQAVWSQWQMENPTPSSPDLPLHKSKQVDLIFPLQHVLLLTDSQFCNKLHCTLGFKCVSAPFPWQ